MLTVWMLCYMLTREGPVQCEPLSTHVRCTLTAHRWYLHAQAWAMRSRLKAEALYSCLEVPAPVPGAAPVQGAAPLTARR